MKNLIAKITVLGVLGISMAGAIAVSASENKTCGTCCTQGKCCGKCVGDTCADCCKK